MKPREVSYKEKPLDQIFKNFKKGEQKSWNSNDYDFNKVNHNLKASKIYPSETNILFNQ